MTYDNIKVYKLGELWVWWCGKCGGGDRWYEWRYTARGAFHHAEIHRVRDKQPR